MSPSRCHVTAFHRDIAPGSDSATGSRQVLTISDLIFNNSPSSSTVSILTTGAAAEFRTSPVQHRQIGFPRPDRLAILLRHDTGDLRQVTKVVRHPRRQQLLEGDAAERGMLAREPELLRGQGQRAQVAEILRPELRGTRRIDRSTIAPCCARCGRIDRQGRNAGAAPCSRMMRTRGIQSVISPSIKWPTTSNGLHVSPPSFPVVHSTGRFDRSASTTPGVRSRMASPMGRSNRIPGEGCVIFSTIPPGAADREPDGRVVRIW